VLGALLAAGCGTVGTPADDTAAVPLEVRFELDEAAFEAPPAPQAFVPFDVVSADMEGDGDPDLLLNWHNRAPLELFENRGGGFALVNLPADDHSGLDENPGIADIYGPVEQTLALARAAGPGVYLWHEPDRRGDWHIQVTPAGEPVTLSLRANGALTLHIDRRYVVRQGEVDAELVVDEPLHFRADIYFVASQLAVEASLPLYVGGDLTAAGIRADLWKDDPHGIAWVNVRGTPPPEIYVSRGGLTGELLPPLDPKVDRFYEYDGGDPLYRDVRDATPANYGRGRRVEWVDVDGDGVNELYVGNTATPNALLVASDDGSYTDLAAAAGVDFLAGDTFAWLDVDGDGRDDLVFVDESGFALAYNRGDLIFERGDAAAVGLRFPAGSEPVSEELFDVLSLHVLDVDSDGRLDLWLAGHGEGRGHALYRGTGEGFEEVTEAFGLSAAPLANSIVFLDRDNDGDEDAVTFGAGAAWLVNDDGQRFAVEPMDPEWGLREFTRAAPLDVDGDGRVDLALFGHRRLLLRNATVGGGSALSVLPRAAEDDPVGTVVTAIYASGRVRAQRYGSTRSTQYSQGSGSLHFGIAHGDRIERLQVRWPDGTIEERPVDAAETYIEVRR